MSTYMMESKMRNDEVIELINSYKKLESLWNFRSPKYKKVELKNKAWMQLAKMFNRDVADVKKKIKYLRSAYVNEKKKVDESILSGASGDDLYRPRLFYYDDLSFLDSVIVLRQCATMYETSSSSQIELDIDKLEEDEEIKYLQDNEYCMEYVAMPSPSPSLSESIQDKDDNRCLSPSSSSSFKIETTAEPLVYSPKSGENDKLYEAFGRTIAMQLAQMTPLEANSTMDVIHRLVSRDVMRSLLARTKPKLSATTVEHPYIKRKRQIKD